MRNNVKKYFVFVMNLLLYFILSNEVFSVIFFKKRFDAFKQFKAFAIVTVGSYNDNGRNKGMTALLNSTV